MLTKGEWCNPVCNMLHHVTALPVVIGGRITKILYFIKITQLWIQFRAKTEMISQHYKIENETIVGNQIQK